MPASFHFLVVDDQSITRSSIIAMLNKLGHTNISEAENGQQAWGMLQSGASADIPVNFVISDCRMPVMDGLTLLRTIRASRDWQDLPVLLMTPDAALDDITVAMQAGADEYIDKQFLNRGFLEVAIHTILARKGFISGRSHYGRH